MKYVAIIDDQQYEIDIDEDGKVLINGEPRDVDFLNLGGSLFSVITENKSLEAVINEDEGPIAVMMGGRLYETQVLDERAMLMMQRRGGQMAGSGELRAPMPGLIVEVAAQPGESRRTGADPGHPGVDEDAERVALAHGWRGALGASERGRSGGKERAAGRAPPAEQ